jgi:hypothetical protein
MAPANLSIKFKILAIGFHGKIIYISVKINNNYEVWKLKISNKQDVWEL